MQKFFDTLIIFAPLILIFMLIFLSIFNQDFKALIFILGLSISLYIFIKALSGQSDDENDSNALFCKLFEFYDIKIHSQIVYAFLFMMIFLPMLINKSYNFFLLVSIGVLIFIDFIYRFLNCLNNSDEKNMFTVESIKKLFTTLIWPAFWGLTSGILWFYLVYFFDESGDFLYFDSVRTNRLQCKYTKNTEYTCGSSS